jgi:hypothetical protein
MRNSAIILSGLIILFSIGCSGYIEPYNPVYPYDDYDDIYYDYGPLYSDNITGEWEGYLYEDSRSDYLDLGEKTVAMRAQWIRTYWSDGVRHEVVEINLLIDGRPAAYLNTEIGSDGAIYFTSSRNDIDLDMEGWFYDDYGDGSMYLAWDEKIKMPDTDKVDMHYVELDGDFELDRVRGSQWAEAWKLFDTMGEGVFQLSDDAWKNISMAGIENLAPKVRIGMRK